MTIGILVVLVIANAVWLATSEYSSPLIALIFYALIAFLCWRRSHFQAGIIGGIVGLGVHIYELLSQGIIELRGLELGLFFINLTFPIPLIYFSYRAYQEIKRRGRKDLKINDIPSPTAYDRREDNMQTDRREQQ